MPLLKLNQHINITLRPKIIPENGTKKREFPNVVASAKIGNPVFGNVDVSGHEHTP